MNGVCYGNNIFPVQDGKINDGVLDFILYKSISRLKFSGQFNEYSIGNLEKLGDLITKCEAKEITLTQKSKKSHIMVDGEVVEVPKNSTVSVKVLPAALKFIVPKNVHPLRGKLGGVSIAD